ncbi:DUF6461 domain-containing protein [Nonomuraea purpurea]|uniref:DUF6461 domain-containing protein n=1 Tax=Nonomuraea purpurea TaxID=1849276 RepID=A0ABV8FW81_9ACTN
MIEALLAAGADPWIEVMCGWSAGRLALAGPRASLFACLPGVVPLEEEHRAAIQRARERKTLLDNTAHLGGEWAVGMGLALVAGISADEAIRRLGADPARFAPHPPRPAPWLSEDEDDEDDEDDLYTAGLQYVAVTEIAGGCALVQPEGFAVTLNETVNPLSAGTHCVAVYFNAKSGTQSSYVIDGEEVDRDPVSSDARPGEDPARTLDRFLLLGPKQTGPDRSRDRIRVHAAGPGSRRRLLREGTMVQVGPSPGVEPVLTRRCFSGCCFRCGEWLSSRCCREERVPAVDACCCDA